MALQVSEIYIYPIKSVGGIRVNEANTAERGFENDRRWMLIDENNQFITQRKHHKMALLKATIEQGHIIVSAAQLGLSSLSIAMEAPDTTPIDVTIWNDTTQAVSISEEADKWFSDALEMRCRLVKMAPVAQRQIKKKWAYKDESVSFADEYPYLFLGQSSLDDLNSRLSAPVPMDRFRPNVVFTGGQPYEEDHWAGQFEVGNAQFKGLKPCKRCVLTTIDQETGTQGKEPLQTLASYRKGNDGGVIFGQHVIAINNAQVKVGDTIKI